MPRAGVGVSALLLLLGLVALVGVWRYFPAWFTGRDGPVVVAPSSSTETSCTLTLRVEPVHPSQRVEVSSFGLGHRSWHASGPDPELPSLPCDHALRVRVFDDDRVRFDQTFSVPELDAAAGPEKRRATIRVP